MKPPIHNSVETEWFDEAPSEPGFYWLLGDPYMGSMGGHDAGTIEPENRLLLVEVCTVSNGLMAVANGNFMQLEKWYKGKRGEGWVGKWARAILPKVEQ